MKKDHVKVLSKREEELLRNLKVVDTVVHAAVKMGIGRKTAYNMLYRLRQKYYKARKLVNTIEGNKRGNPLIKKVLTDRFHAVDREELTARELEVEEDLN